MNTLQMHPPEATHIGTSCFSFVTRDGRTVYFSNLDPCDFHDAGDRSAMLLRIAKFAEGGVRRADLEEAFDVGRATLQRAVNKLREHGEASFHEPRRGHGPSVIVGETVQTAERLLASGMSGAAVARELGVPTATLNYNRRRGFISDGRPEAGTPATGAQAEAPQIPQEPDAGTVVPDQDHTDRDTPDLLDRSARDQRDRAAPMGRGARDSAGRVLASAGMMVEAQPRFDEALSAVACGGVLAALPMLLAEGLLDRAHRFLSVPKGSYGLTSVLVLLAFLFMARVRNPEALRRHPPGEWGAILGLDRCPEAEDAAAQDQGAGIRPAAGEELAGQPRTGVDEGWAGCPRHPVGGRAREGLHRAQGPSAEALRLAPEALSAGLDELLDQCARRQAGAVHEHGPRSGHEPGAGTRHPAGTGSTGPAGGGRA